MSDLRQQVSDLQFDFSEIMEVCRIAQHLGGPQNLSAVGIGRYLRVCSPEAIMALKRSETTLTEALIKWKHEADQLKGECATLRATIDQQKSLIESLREDLNLAIAIDCNDDAIEACAEVERTGTPGSVIREMNDELVDLRRDAERFRFIEQDADSGMRRIYGDDWIAVIDAGGVQP